MRAASAGPRSERHPAAWLWERDHGAPNTAMAGARRSICDVRIELRMHAGHGSGSRAPPRRRWVRNDMPSWRGFFAETISGSREPLAWSGRYGDSPEEVNGGDGGACWVEHRYLASRFEAKHGSSNTPRMLVSVRAASVSHTLTSMDRVRTGHPRIVARRSRTWMTGKRPRQGKKKRVLNVKEPKKVVDLS